jgi:Rv0078B-related antitoxin
VTTPVFGAIKMEMKLEPLHPVQIQRFRQMTPVEKWDVALGLLRTARETRRAGLRRRNPNLTATELERALAKELSCART